MGVHVVLDIEPTGIDDSAWAQVYDDTLALLEAWRPRLLGWGSRMVEGARVAMYARSIRGNAADPGKECWTVVGDRESLQTAEGQSVYRDLSRYRRGARRVAVDDIVAAAAAPARDDTSGPVRVFGDKTQGHPYHAAMLAAAMVVEERFPRYAMVRGNIDRPQAEGARDMAARILGRELALPVRVDAPRLLERLRAVFEPHDLAGAFERVYLGSVPTRRDVVRALGAGGSAVDAWALENAERRQLGELLLDSLMRGGDDTEALATIADPKAMGTAQQEWLRKTTWAVTQVQERTGPAVSANLANPNEARSALTRRLADHPVVLTEDAWDAVLAEQDSDVLRFWIALVGMRDVDLHTWQVRRALFENRVLLRHAMTLARDETEMRKAAALVEEERARRNRG